MSFQKPEQQVNTSRHFLTLYAKDAAEITAAAQALPEETRQQWEGFDRSPAQTYELAAGPLRDAPLGGEGPLYRVDAQDCIFSLTLVFKASGAESYQQARASVSSMREQFSASGTEWYPVADIAGRSNPDSRSSYAAGTIIGHVHQVRIDNHGNELR